MNQLNCGWRVLCGRRHGEATPKILLPLQPPWPRHSSIGGSNNRSLTAAEPTHSLAPKAPPVLKGRGGGSSDMGTARGLAAPTASATACRAEDGRRLGKVCGPWEVKENNRWVRKCRVAGFTEATR